MDNEWKNNLRERFSDYSASEPEGLWEGIEQGLARQKRRRMLPVWVAAGLSAAAAVTLVLVPRSGGGPESGPGPEPVLAEVIPDTLSTIPGTDSVSVLIPISDQVSHAVPVARKGLIAEMVPETPEKQADIMPDNPDVQEDAPFVETVPEYVAETVDVNPETPGTALSDIIPEVEEDPSPETFQGGVTLGIYREGGQDAVESSTGFGLVNSEGYLTRSTGDGDADRSGLVRMLSANRASSFEAHHSAPVRIGISVAWQFSPILSLVSGVNWTTLSSTLEESTADTRTVTEQELGYLGIPLRLEAGFRPWKGLRLYAGAGGMVETGLLSSARTVSYIGDHSENPVLSRPDTGGLLWSVGVLAGLEYRFNPYWGVYFSPGLEYHFDNGSDIRSAYTDKPLHYNLSFGGRFNFGK